MVCTETNPWPVQVKIKKKERKRVSLSHHITKRSKVQDPNHNPKHPQSRIPAVERFLDVHFGVRSAGRTAFKDPWPGFRVAPRSAKTFRVLTLRVPWGWIPENILCRYIFSYGRLTSTKLTHWVGKSVKEGAGIILPWVLVEKDGPTGRISSRITSSHGADTSNSRCVYGHRRKRTYLVISLVIQSKQSRTKQELL